MFKICFILSSQYNGYIVYNNIVSHFFFFKITTTYVRLSTNRRLRSRYILQSDDDLRARPFFQSMQEVYVPQ